MKATPQNLTEHLLSLPHCTRQIKLELAELFQQVNISKGQLLISPVKYHRSVYFIEQGLFRTYSHQAIPSTTLQLHRPGDYLLQEGMYLSRPASHFTEALSDATIQRIDYPQLERFLNKQPQAVKLLLAILEKRHLALSEENAILHLSSATDRYQMAIDYLGKDFFNVPKHVLASYLAISLKHLRR
ncbi:MAG: Crp/Fnr family transcriptional regulator, partial [Sphingobacteriales bacterium]